MESKSYLTQLNLARDTTGETAGDAWFLKKARILMCWPISLSRADVEADANIVLEGTILYQYDAYIPGVAPLTIGTHYLFKPNPTLVRSDGLGKHISPLAAAVGFWTYRGFLDLPLDRQIRVSLLLHQNPCGYLTLMPYPCSNFSAVDLLSGESLLRVAKFDADKSKFLADRIDEMPFRIETWEPGIGSDEFNPMTVRFGRTIPPTPGDISLAYDIWTAAWPGDPAVTFRKVVNLEPSPTGYYEPAHFRAIFTRIAPYQPGRLTVLANTDSPPCPDYAVGPPNHYIRFNQDVTWSLPGNRATADQYDFQTVMAHEMGHALGLGHLNSDEQNVMYEQILVGAQKTLQAPCVDAITNKYP